MRREWERSVRSFYARPRIRRVGVLVLAIALVGNAIVITISLNSPGTAKSHRIVTFTWILVAIALVSLGRYWRSIPRPQP